MLRNSNSGLGIFHGTTVWTKLVLQLWKQLSWHCCRILNKHRTPWKHIKGKPIPKFSVQMQGKYEHLLIQGLHYLPSVKYWPPLPWESSSVPPAHSASRVTCTSLKRENRVLLEKTYHSSFHRLALRGDSVAGTWSPRLHSQHQVCHCWWIFGWDLVCCFQWNVKWGIKMACTTRQKALHCITDLS